MDIYYIKIKDKYYIGQSIRGYKKRIKEHISYLKRGVHHNEYLQKAWVREKGVIESGVLDSYDTLKEGSEKERFWIKNYNSFHDGYNLTTGGASEHIVSDETKEKQLLKKQKTVGMYDLELGIIKTFPSATKAAIYLDAIPAQINSACRKQTYACGYMWKYLKDKWKTSNNRIGRKVWRYNLKGEFIKSYSSLKEASKQIGEPATAIAGVANGNRKSHKGYMYFYERQNTPNYKNNGWKKVVALDKKTNERVKEFNSVSEAAEWSNTYASGISATLGGYYKSYKGYRWIYD